MNSNILPTTQPGLATKTALLSASSSWTRRGLQIFDEELKELQTVSEQMQQEDRIREEAERAEVSAAICAELRQRCAASARRQHTRRGQHLKTTTTNNNTFATAVSNNNINSAGERNGLTANTHDTVDRKNTDNANSTSNSLTDECTLSPAMQPERDRLLALRLSELQHNREQQNWRQMIRTFEEELDGVRRAAHTACTQAETELQFFSAQPPEQYSMADIIGMDRASANPAQPLLTTASSPRSNIQRTAADMCDTSAQRTGSTKKTVTKAYTAAASTSAKRRLSRQQTKQQHQDGAACDIPSRKSLSVSATGASVALPTTNSAQGVAARHSRRGRAPVTSVTSSAVEKRRSSTSESDDKHSNNDNKNVSKTINDTALFMTPFTIDAVQFAQSYNATLQKEYNYTPVLGVSAAQRAAGVHALPSVKQPNHSQDTAPATEGASSEQVDLQSLRNRLKTHGPGLATLPPKFCCLSTVAATCDGSIDAGDSATVSQDSRMTATAIAGDNVGWTENDAASASQLALQQQAQQQQQEQHCFLTSASARTAGAANSSIAKSCATSIKGNRSSRKNIGTKLTHDKDACSLGIHCAAPNHCVLLQSCTGNEVSVVIRFTNRNPYRVRLRSARASHPWLTFTCLDKAPVAGGGIASDIHHEEELTTSSNKYDAHNGALSVLVNDEDSNDHEDEGAHICSSVRHVNQTTGSSDLFSIAARDAAEASSTLSKRSEIVAASSCGSYASAAASPGANIFTKANATKSHVRRSRNGDVRSQLVCCGGYIDVKVTFAPQNTALPVLEETLRVGVTRELNARSRAGAQWHYVNVMVRAETRMPSFRLHLDPSSQTVTTLADFSCTNTVDLSTAVLNYPQQKQHTQALLHEKQHCVVEGKNASQDATYDCIFAYTLVMGSSCVHAQLENISSSALVTLRSSGSAFAVEPSSETAILLPQGDFMDVDLIFRPQQEGPVKGEMVVVVREATTGSVLLEHRFRLYGVGVVPRVQIVHLGEMNVDSMTVLTEDHSTSLTTLAKANSDANATATYSDNQCYRISDSRSDRTHDIATTTRAMTRCKAGSSGSTNNANTDYVDDVTAKPIGCTNLIHMPNRTTARILRYIVDDCLAGRPVTVPVVVQNATPISLPFHWLCDDGNENNNSNYKNRKDMTEECETLDVRVNNKESVVVTRQCAHNTHETDELTERAGYVTDTSNNPDSFALPSSVRPRQAHTPIPYANRNEEQDALQHMCKKPTLNADGATALPDEHVTPQVTITPACGALAANARTHFTLCFTPQSIHPVAVACSLFLHGLPHPHRCPLGVAAGEPDVACSEAEIWQLYSRQKCIPCRPNVQLPWAEGADPFDVFMPHMRVQNDQAEGSVSRHAQNSYLHGKNNNNISSSTRMNRDSMFDSVDQNNSDKDDRSGSTSSENVRMNTRSTFMTGFYLYATPALPAVHLLPARLMATASCLVGQEQTRHVTLRNNSTREVHFTWSLMEDSSSREGEGDLRRRTQGCEIGCRNDNNDTHRNNVVPVMNQNISRAAVGARALHSARITSVNMSTAAMTHRGKGAALLQKQHIPCFSSDRNNSDVNDVDASDYARGPDDVLEKQSMTVYCVPQEGIIPANKCTDVRVNFTLHRAGHCSATLRCRVPEVDDYVDLPNGSYSRSTVQNYRNKAKKSSILASKTSGKYLLGTHDTHALRFSSSVQSPMLLEVTATGVCAAVTAQSSLVDFGLVALDNVYGVAATLTIVNDNALSVRVDLCDASNVTNEGEQHHERNNNTRRANSIAHFQSDEQGSSLVRLQDGTGQPHASALCRFRFEPSCIRVAAHGRAAVQVTRFPLVSDMTDIPAIGRDTLCATGSTSHAQIALCVRGGQKTFVDTIMSVQRAAVCFDRIDNNNTRDNDADRTNRGGDFVNFGIVPDAMWQEGVFALANQALFDVSLTLTRVPADQTAAWDKACAPQLCHLQLDFPTHLHLRAGERCVPVPFRARFLRASGTPSSSDSLTDHDHKHQSSSGTDRNGSRSSNNDSTNDGVNGSRDIQESDKKREDCMHAKCCAVIRIDTRAHASSTSLPSRQNLNKPNSISHPTLTEPQPLFLRVLCEEVQSLCVSVDALTAEGATDIPCCTSSAPLSVWSLPKRFAVTSMPMKDHVKKFVRNSLGCAMAEHTDSFSSEGNRAIARSKPFLHTLHAEPVHLHIRSRRSTKEQPRQRLLSDHLPSQLQSQTATMPCRMHVVPVEHAACVPGDIIPHTLLGSSSVGAVWARPRTSPLRLTVTMSDRTLFCQTPFCVCVVNHTGCAGVTALQLLRYDVTQASEMGAQTIVPASTAQHSPHTRGAAIEDRDDSDAHDHVDHDHANNEASDNMKSNLCRCEISVAEAREYLYSGKGCASLMSPPACSSLSARSHSPIRITPLHPFAHLHIPVTLASNMPGLYEEHIRIQCGMPRSEDDYAEDEAETTGKDAPISNRAAGSAGRVKHSSTTQRHTSCHTRTTNSVSHEDNDTTTTTAWRSTTTAEGDTTARGSDGCDFSSVAWQTSFSTRKWHSLTPATLTRVVYAVYGRPILLDPTTAGLTREGERDVLMLPPVLTPAGRTRRHLRLVNRSPRDVNAHAMIFLTSASFAVAPVDESVDAQSVKLRLSMIDPADADTNTTPSSSTTQSGMKDLIVRPASSSRASAAVDVQPRVVLIPAMSSRSVLVEYYTGSAYTGAAAHRMGNAFSQAAQHDYASTYDDNKFPNCSYEDDDDEDDDMSEDDEDDAVQSRSELERMWQGSLVVRAELARSDFNDSFLINEFYTRYAHRYPSVHTVAGEHVHDTSSPVSGRLGKNAKSDASAHRTKQSSKQQQPSPPGIPATQRTAASTHMTRMQCGIRLRQSNLLSRANATWGQTSARTAPSSLLPFLGVQQPFRSRQVQGGLWVVRKNVIPRPTAAELAVLQRTQVRSSTARDSTHVLRRHDTHESGRQDAPPSVHPDPIHGNTRHNDVRNCSRNAIHSSTCSSKSHNDGTVDASSPGSFFASSSSSVITDVNETDGAIMGCFHEEGAGSIARTAVTSAAMLRATEQERDELRAYIQQRHDELHAMSLRYFLPIELQLRTRCGVRHLHISPRTRVVRMPAYRSHVHCARTIRLTNRNSAALHFTLDMDQARYLAVSQVTRRDEDGAVRDTHSTATPAAAVTTQFATETFAATATSLSSVVYTLPGGESLDVNVGVVASASVMQGLLRPQETRHTLHDALHIHFRDADDGKSDMHDSNTPHVGRDSNKDNDNYDRDNNHYDRHHRAHGNDEMTQTVPLSLTIARPVVTCTPSVLVFIPGEMTHDGRPQPSYAQQLMLKNMSRESVHFRLVPQNTTASHSNNHHDRNNNSMDVEAEYTNSNLCLTRRLNGVSYTNENIPAQTMLLSSSSSIDAARDVHPAAITAETKENTNRVTGMSAVVAIPMDPPVVDAGRFALHPTRGVIPSASRGGEPGTALVRVTFSECLNVRYTCVYVLEVEGHATSTTITLYGNSRQTEV